MKKWTRGKVTDKTQWTNALYSLRFEAPLDEFTAGQFVQIAMDIEGERVARSYSLVNAPKERPLEIYFREVAEGPLTPRLSELEPGDKFWVSEKASGVFVIDRVPECRDLWMFSTGTALGVYLSMLKTESPWRRFNNIVLVHGCRNAEEFNYRDLIDELSLRHGNQFQFITAHSREHKKGMLHGRLTTLLANGAIENMADGTISTDDSHVMLCGSDMMISDMRRLLEARGLQRHTSRQQGHYTTEKYH